MINFINIEGNRRNLTTCQAAKKIIKILHIITQLKV